VEIETVPLGQKSFVGGGVPISNDDLETDTHGGVIYIRGEGMRIL
jgi:hypothetical protein